MIQAAFNKLLNQIVKQELRIKLDVSVEIGANMSVAEIEKDVMTQVSAMFPSKNKKIQSLAYAEECAIYSTDGKIKWSFLETDWIGRIEVTPGHDAKAIRTSHDMLTRLMDDYSDSGYMNTHGGDIIIDLSYIEDDAHQLAHFFEITGLTEDRIKDVSYICFYA